MTTDNRTNEPNQNETKSGQEFCFTEAQVDAAAKAIADCHNPGMFEKYPENWRVEARAALVAAQGAAPQAEVLPSNRENCPGSGGHAGCGNFCSMCFLTAPVLPSSTVDEDALVQRIYDELMTDDAVAEVWSNGKVMATARRIVKFAVQGGESR